MFYKNGLAAFLLKETYKSDFSFNLKTGFKIKNFQNLNVSLLFISILPSSPDHLFCHEFHLLYLRFFFWLRMKKARVGLLMALIFSGCKSGSLFVCFFFFLGVFELSHTENEFSIWSFKHHFWFSILVLNYHWILHLFFFSFFVEAIVSETIVVL